MVKDSTDTMNSQAQVDAMSSSGYRYAVQVLDLLKDDAASYNTCLVALDLAQAGQSLLYRGDSESAVIKLQKAESLFEKLPDALPLLGICKADLSAAFCNLGRYHAAAMTARASIWFLSGDRRFAFTEAMAKMSLGNSLYMLGKPKGGARCLDDARRILRTLPEATQYLAVIDRIQRDLQNTAGEHRAKWWQFWKRLKH
jgi:tetratricopeptide (TPR) repeat protein